jgi:hypothetical protein
MLLRIVLLVVGVDIVGTIIGNPHHPRIKLPNHYYIELTGHAGAWLLVGVVLAVVAFMPSGSKKK